ncbi:MAG: ADP-forming succinate--CoA ligase subunit beta [Anaerolineae bacterium]|nr:ADP-forming succinate--CoA ligase subunit beta [Anaerolineae bacterium]
MKLHEYQSKIIFRKYGVPIPQGYLAMTANEAKRIAEELGDMVVIKSQVLVGGRGKAGGIRLAKNPKETEEFAAEILAMEIKGLPVRKVLVDEAVNFVKEIYLGITHDRQMRCPIMIASSAGGVDIEEIALATPEKIFKVPINPLYGIRDFQARNLAVCIDLPRDLWKEFIEICRSLWMVFSETDAIMAEINPLVITTKQKLMALDGKMVIDDNALFRQPDFLEYRDVDMEDASEIEARKYGLSYVHLDGDIGCMVNGAGLAMTTMDVIQFVEGKPANFLDVGGGASAEKVAIAFRIILSDPNVKVILINIFGGITRCDEVARGILAAMGEIKPTVKLVVRLVGTNANEGLDLLKKQDIITAPTLLDAAKKAVGIAKGAIV